MYRLYVQKQQGGWDSKGTGSDIEKIHKSLKALQKEGYYSYLIIRNEGNGDEVFERR